jgi:hypothetical protein
MIYEPVGPVQIPTNDAGSIDAKNVGRRGNFWDQLDERYPKLSTAKGIYAFCAQTGTRYRPWYVGKTNGFKGFRGEVFGAHKLLHYNLVIHDHYQNRFTPVFFFLVRKTEGGKLSWRPPPKELEFVEKLIIGRALERNPDLRNIAETKYLRGLTVYGVTHGRQDRSSMEFKKVWEGISLERGNGVDAHASVPAPENGLDATPPTPAE